jgi:pseudouridine synthase
VLAVLLGSAAFSLPQPKSISSDKVQILLLAAGYLALSLYIVPAAASSKIELFAHAAVAAVAGFAGAYLALRFAHLPASPGIFGLGGCAAAAAALVPHLAARLRLVALLAFLMAAAALVAAPRLMPARSSIDKESIDTALYGVNLDTYSGLVPRPEADGGAIESHGSGLLLITDDGQINHRLSSPRTHLPKVYEAQVASDLRGDEADIFASGTLMLASETTPLAPAALEVLGARSVRLTLSEGRYHQARRMFAAVGNHVESLHRSAIGGLELGSLESGMWRVLEPSDMSDLFAD